MTKKGGEKYRPHACSGEDYCGLIGEILWENPPNQYPVGMCYGLYAGIREGQDNIIPQGTGWKRESKKAFFISAFCYDYFFFHRHPSGFSLVQAPCHVQSLGEFRARTDLLSNT